MAEQPEQQPQEQDVECDDTDNPNYKPPAQKSLNEIQQLDADDESLKKYKELLLGASEGLPVFPNDPRNVIIQKLSFCSEGREEIELDLTGDLKEVSKKVFVVKEGSKYHLKIFFYVQREIVCGMAYKHRTTRKGIQVDKGKLMVGSYPPKRDLQCYKTPEEDVPSGMLARGTYHIYNEFTDDDKSSIAAWDFKLEIKKDWE